MNLIEAPVIIGGTSFLQGKLVPIEGANE